MKKTLLIGYDVLAILWSNIQDDTSNSSLQFNFLQDEHSRMLADREAWLCRQIGSNIEKLKEWYKPGTKRANIA
jgi:hypothetical protein